LKERELWEFIRGFPQEGKDTSHASLRRVDQVRAKLDEMGIDEQDVALSEAWVMIAFRSPIHTLGV